MGTTVTMKLNELLAISQFSGKEETRYYLCGVYIEAREGLNPLMVATNGHYLGSLNLESDYLEKAGSERGGFILGSDTIKKIEALAKLENLAIPLAVTIEGVKNGGVFSLKISLHFDSDREKERGVLHTLEERAVDGNFPDFRRVIPAHPDAEKPKADKSGELVRYANAVAFNAGYIAVFQKAHALLTGTKKGGVSGLKMAITDEGAPIHISLANCPNFLGVLMPMRWNG